MRTITRAQYVPSKPLAGSLRHHLRVTLGYRRPHEIDGDRLWRRGVLGRARHRPLRLCAPPPLFAEWLGLLAPAFNPGKHRANESHEHTTGRVTSERLPRDQRITQE